MAQPRSSRDESEEPSIMDSVRKILNSGNGSHARTMSLNRKETLFRGASQRLNKALQKGEGLVECEEHAKLTPKLESFFGVEVVKEDVRNCSKQDRHGSLKRKEIVKKNKLKSTFSAPVSIDAPINRNAPLADSISVPSSASSISNDNVDAFLNEPINISVSAPLNHSLNESTTTSAVNAPPEQNPPLLTRPTTVKLTPKLESFFGVIDQVKQITDEEPLNRTQSVAGSKAWKKASLNSRALSRAQSEAPIAPAPRLTPKLEQFFGTNDSPPQREDTAEDILRKLGNLGRKSKRVKARTTASIKDYRSTIAAAEKSGVVSTDKGVEGSGSCPTSLVSDPKQKVLRREGAKLDLNKLEGLSSYRPKKTLLKQDSKKTLLIKQNAEKALSKMCLEQSPGDTKSSSDGTNSSSDGTNSSSGGTKSTPGGTKSTHGGTKSGYVGKTTSPSGAMIKNYIGVAKSGSDVAKSDPEITKSGSDVAKSGSDVAKGGIEATLNVNIASVPKTPLAERLAKRQATLIFRDSVQDLKILRPSSVLETKKDTEDKGAVLIIAAKPSLGVPAVILTPAETTFATAKKTTSMLSALRSRGKKTRSSQLVVTVD